MGKESKEGNRYHPGMTNEIKMYRSRESGRLYTISQVLKRGLLILKSEDGLGTAMSVEDWAYKSGDGPHGGRKWDSPTLELIGMKDQRSTGHCNKSFDKTLTSF